MASWEKWRQKDVTFEEGLLSRVDAAKYLDVSIRTFDKYIAQELLVSYKLPGGRLRKFKKEDLEKFVSENKA